MRNWTNAPFNTLMILIHSAVIDMILVCKEKSFLLLFYSIKPSNPAINGVFGIFIFLVPWGTRMYLYRTFSLKMNKRTGIKTTLRYTELGQGVSFHLPIKQLRELLNWPD